MSGARRDDRTKEQNRERRTGRVRSFVFVFFVFIFIFVFVFPVNRRLLDVLIRH